MYWETKLFSALFVLTVGAAVRHANPKRLVNREFFWSSLLVAGWLFAGVLGSGRFGLHPSIGVRASAVIAGFVPWSLWNIKNAIISPEKGVRSPKRSVLLALVGVLVAAIAMSPYFLRINPDGFSFRLGGGWTLCTGVQLLSFAAVGLGGLRAMKLEKGVHRIEIEILLVGGAMAGLLGTALTVLRLSHTSPGIAALPAALAPIISVLFYSATVWGITSQRVFDAQYLFRTIGRVLVLVSVSIGLVAACSMLGRGLPGPVVWVATGLVGVMVMFFFRRFGWKSVASSRGKWAEGVREAAWKAADEDELVAKAGGELAKGAGVEHAYIWPLHEGGYGPIDKSIPSTSFAIEELKSNRWATPESLSRGKESRGTVALAEMLGEYRLGLVVVVPETQTTVSAMIAVQVRYNGAPFTYPEVEVIMELGTIIGAGLARLGLVRRTREAERMAAAGKLGVSIAHEIRNPLVPLKTLVQNLETAAPGSEREAHAIRKIREIFPAEVKRIETLVSGLMDLGRAGDLRMARIAVNDVVEWSAKVVGPTAREHNIDIVTEFGVTGRGIILGDKGALQQVLLNLMLNGVQALGESKGDRLIKLRTYGADRTVSIEVSDNGPGIPPALRGRLFRAFTSGKVNGLGMGLAISADIVKGHRGNIALVPGSGQGTTFRIKLPCAPDEGEERESV